jgi:hypothetical protein
MMVVLLDGVEEAVDGTLGTAGLLGGLLDGEKLRHREEGSGGCTA